MLQCFLVNVSKFEKIFDILDDFCSLFSDDCGGVGWYVLIVFVVIKLRKCFFFIVCCRPYDNSTPLIC